MKHLCRSLATPAALLLTGLCVLLFSGNVRAQAGPPDAKAGDAPSVFIFRLRNANAANAAKFLTQVVQTWAASDGADAPKQSRQIVADSQTNSVLVMGFSGKESEALKNLLGNLDAMAPSAGQSAGIEHRLDQLERQVQSLLTDIQSLRQELKTPQRERNGN